MAVLSDFNARVAISVKDTAGIYTSGDRDAFIQTAVRAYSRDKPRRQDDLLIGDGTKQSFSAPTGWVDRFSVAISLEHPVGEVPLRMLDLQDNLEITQVSNVQRVLLTTLTLGSGETARITYTTPHTVDGAGSSIPDSDFSAVCDLAASFLARGLAAFYAEETNSTIAADVVAGASRADTYARLASDLFGAYKEHISDGEVVTPVIRYHDQDMRDRYGRDYIIHRSRWR